MESIEKLRDWAADEHTVYHGLEMETFTGKLTAYEKCKLDAIVDNLESEIAEKYMELPVDADGLPIHVGDEIIYLNGGKRFIVRMIGDGFVRSEIGALYQASICRHVKPRTLRDILFDFMRDCCCNSELSNAELVEKYEVELRELLGGDAE